MPLRLVVPIDQGWAFREADSGPSASEDAAGPDAQPWLPVSQFPTNVHLDLLAHQRIPDPFVGKNEALVQWVGERRWVYKTSFGTPAAASPATKTVLAFDGLDTFASVVLNGTPILESDNMFLPHRVDVSSVVAPAGGAPNELVITFDSASARGWQRVAEHPEHKWGCWNGEISRLAVRKAQYHWGWDWGPTLMTCGPWRPVAVEVYAARIADLSFTTDVAASLQAATVDVHAELEATAAAVLLGAQVRFDVSLGGVAVASETVVVDAAVAAAAAVEGGDGDGEDAAAAVAVTATFHISSPALWYPARYGAQPLYTVRATLLTQAAAAAADALEAADAVTKRIGLRRAALVQRAVQGQAGTSFFFEVNNIAVFCGGSNWIPADSFVPRIGRQRYYDWVRLAVEGQQGMIRVWGGGIYEEQAFYDACDELGVLVWQDFMFGCGNYPAWAALRTSIRREAEANIRRLRHHASIVVWAGNNEDYQYQESEGLTYDFGNRDAASWLRTDFPARYIYEKILADACAALAPATAYHFGSPWGAGVDTHDPTVGDIHQWNVWHGTQEKYQNFDRLVGRFVSEFGMEAFPSVRTVDALLPQGRADPDRYAQSATLDWHNKADGHERRLALYLVENIRYAPDPLEQYVYSTQLMQAECLASAYRLWRRQWKGPGREYCGGALVWQLNDCWPVTSWSICDYYLRPKHAYFAIKREMAAVTVGLVRRVVAAGAAAAEPGRVGFTDWAAGGGGGGGGGAVAGVKTSLQPPSRAPPPPPRIEVWGSNLTLAGVAVDCVVRAWDVETGRRTFEARVAAGQQLAANRSTELAVLDVPVPDVPVPAEAAARTVVAAYLYDAAGTQVARCVNWPEPLKYLHWAAPQQLAAALAATGDAVELRAEVPVKGVAVEVDGDDAAADAVRFDDNLVDLVPGEVVRIGVRGATEATRFRTRYLGMQV